MNTKLTLTMEQKIIERAKKYAKRKGQSLSYMIENYLKAVTKSEYEPDKHITPITKSLRGTFKAPADFDYKMQISKNLAKKYL